MSSPGGTAELGSWKEPLLPTIAPADFELELKQKPARYFFVPTTAVKKKTGFAVYAGSFDPLTIGHLWMIQEGRRLFKTLRVAIGINPDKKYSFTLDDRLEMLRRSTNQFPNVTIASFSNLYLVDYAQSIGATHILRGVRSAADFEFERAMRNINGDFDPRITTVFLMPPRDIAEVSSSMVKGLIGPKGWQKIVRRYVPVPVYQQLLKLKP